MAVDITFLTPQYLFDSLFLGTGKGQNFKQMYEKQILKKKQLKKSAKDRFYNLRNYQISMIKKAATLAKTGTSNQIKSSRVVRKPAVDSNSYNKSHSSEHQENTSKNRSFNNSLLMKKRYEQEYLLTESADQDPTRLAQTGDPKVCASFAELPVD